MKDLLISLRPKQWTKNLLLFLALLFSMNLHWDPSVLSQWGDKPATAALAFALFCLLSSSGYLINDLIDLNADRAHPTKRNRPLPSGRLQRWQAATVAALLLALALYLGFQISTPFGLVGLTYWGLMLVYSLLLRRMIIIDVFTISTGFVLRAVAGAVAIAVPVSPWLYIVTFLGALFLALIKRRQELVLLGEEAPRHRPSFQEYTPRLLEEMLAAVTAAIIIAYSLYTFIAANLPPNHTMMLTIPFVIYGIFRYLYLAHVKNMGASPEEVLLRDRPLLINIALWAITVIVVLVWAREFPPA